MSLILILYILNSLLLAVLGGSFLKKYYNLGGLFFIVFCISTALWFIFFILSFFFTQDLTLLELFIKLNYFLSIVTLYSFLLFLVYFQKKRGNILSSQSVGFFLLVIALSLVYIYSPAIIDGLYFNTEQNDWYEKEGAFYNFHLILSVLFIPGVIILSRYRLKRLGMIDKKRLQYILLGVVIFVLLTFFCLLVLPAFGVFSMERYIAIFFLPFIFSVGYSTRRYDFLNFKVTLLQLGLFLYALCCSYLINKIFKNQLDRSFSADFHTYWGGSGNSEFLKLTLGILCFLGIYSFAKQKILPHFQEGGLGSSLERIKLQLPFITNIEGLNSHLKNEFQQNFNIGYVHVSTDIKNYESLLLHYFGTDLSRKYFMNDIVFLEENKNKFGNHPYEEERVSLKHIIFPLRNPQGEVTGVIEIGKKPFGDPFYTSEIRDLETFALFLQGHLKYLSVYGKMQNLSINLDKQVDEKTIEYNDLLSKQKEFIAYVGHEIKNPITNAIFLCDGLKEELFDMKDTKLSRRLREDGSILYGELLKVSELVKQIFSTEQFDLEKVRLYRKEIDVSSFIRSEVHIFQSTSPNVIFTLITSDVKVRKIDTTQFRQVFHNLITNAIKFADENNPQVRVTTKEEGGKLYISIEDNGRGFDDIDIAHIFDKYATGKGSLVGLGMGLYLCKKIVELHGGSIKVGNSRDLGGACFSITI